jgi:hypothetical protein
VRRRVAGLLLALSGLLACASGDREPAGADLLVVPLSDRASAPGGDIRAVVRVEVAADPDARSRGLMFRDGVPEGTGMLFVYPDEDLRRFWMKNTKVALSIAFADADGRIVRILDMEPGYGREDRDLTFHESGEPATYALEVRKGWFRAAGIAVGARLVLHPEIRAVSVR